MIVAFSKRAAVLLVVCVAVLLSSTAAHAVILQPDGSPTTGDANLRLWLDAADLSTLFQDTGGTVAAVNGQQVALWKDKSGNGLDVSQSNAGDRPDYKGAAPNLNANGALFFEGYSGGDMMRAVNSTGILGNDDRTVITVWANRENTGQNYQHAFHMGTNNGYQAYGISVARNGGSNRIGNHYYWAGFDTSASSTDGSQMALAMWDGDGGTGTNGLDSWFVDGTAAGTHERAALNTGATEVLIASRVSGPTEGIRGDIAEVIVYDSTLTAGERSQLGSYLGYKYGLSTVAHHEWLGGTGSYTDPTQWNLGTVPTINEMATIAAGQANSSNLTRDGSGELIVTGTGTLNNTGKLEMSGTAGVLTQSGGTVNTGTLYLGYPGTGYYFMSGGQLNVGSYIVIGTNGTGHFLQSGGTVTQGANKFILGDVSGSTGNTYEMSGSAVLGAREFSLGDKSGSEGTFSISDSAQLTATGTAWIGLTGDGTVNQSGGTANFNSELTLGQNLGSTGTYNLGPNGQITVASTARIGNSGEGTVNQTGGTATFNNWLVLGEGGGSTGTYNMSGGTLNVAGSYFMVGRYGVGHFNQSGSSVVNVNVTTRMMLNDFAGSAGSSYSISGGTLNVNNGVMLAVGKGDAGDFLQTGGTVNLSGDLSLGNGAYRLQDGDLNVTGNIVDAGGTGSFEFDGGTLAVTGGSINVDSLRMAVTGSANPTLTMTAGNTLYVGGHMLVGENNQATVSLTDTTATVGGYLRLGPHSGGNGSVTQTGGSMTVGGRLELTDNAGGASAYTLGGDGTLTVNGDYLIVGRAGAGHFVQNGSSVINLNVSQRLLVGDFGGPAADGSTYTLNGGTLNLNGGKQVSIGKGSAASFTQTGGTFNASGSMRLGEAGNGAGVYNLQGGELNVASYMTIGGSGTGTFNLEGGTLSVDSITTPNGSFNFTGGTLHAGTVGFALTNSGGTLAPGNSPGTTVINGAYVQSSTGTLDIELAGYTPGTEFDLVTVNGAASLDGFLDVTMLGGALPAEHDFVVLTASGGITDLGMDLSYSGPFRMSYSIIDLGAGAQGLQLTYQVPEPGSLFLFVLGGLGLMMTGRRRRR